MVRLIQIWCFFKRSIIEYWPFFLLQSDSNGMTTSKKKQVNQSGWPQAVQTIVIKVIDKGVLIPFGLIVIGAIIAYRMDSSDVTKIVTLLVEKGLFAVLGWILFVATALGMTWLLAAQRNLYIKEIQRISEERNHWQANSCQNIQASRYEATK